MSAEWFIASRYMKSQGRTGFFSFITGFAVLGVVIGTAALIITLSVLDGFEREIKEKVVGFTSHIQVQGFQNVPLEHHQASVQKLTASVQGITSVVPFVAREAMIRSRDGIDGVYIKGIDPGGSVTIPQKYIVRGALYTRDAPQIVLGKKLADRLNVSVGDKVVVFALLSSGTSAGSLQHRARQFEISGLYESGMAEYDDIYAYTSLVQAQDLLRLGDRVSGYDILVDDFTHVDQIAKECEELLGYPHFAHTVFQLYRNLFSWVELQKSLSPIMLSLIIIVATFNIVGTLLMFVLEKTRAIGILKSIGATPRHLRRVFMLQGISIAAVGIVLGNIVSYALCWAQLKFRILSLPSEIYYMQTVPVSLSPHNFVLVSLIAFLLCLLTTILPARAAAKLDPVTALRFG
jgi:lipoprotein-releasing system permease protein